MTKPIIVVDARICSNHSKEADSQKTELISYLKNKNYVVSCTAVYEHLLQEHLSNNEKLFFIVVNLLAAQNFAINSTRKIIKPAKTLALMTGFTSRTVFKLQKSLEDKGYLLVVRRKDCDGLDEINELTPILPESVFSNLSQSKNRSNVDDTSNLNLQQASNYLAYLDSTKMYVALNLKLVCHIFADQHLSSNAKLVWFSFLIKALITCCKNNYFTFSHTTTACELTKSQSVISKAMNELLDDGLLGCNRFWAYKRKNTSNRKKWSLWEGWLLLRDDLRELIDSIPDRLKLVATSRMQNLPAKHSEISYKYTKYNKINNILKNNVEPEAVDNSSCEALQPATNVFCNKKYLQLKAEYGRRLDLAVAVYKDAVIAKQKADQQFSAEELKILASPPPVVKPQPIPEPATKPHLPPKLKPCHKGLDSVLKLLCASNRSKLLPDIISKTYRFVAAIRTRKIARGYAAQISYQELRDEILHHVANWQPTKIVCTTARERQDAALSVAWKNIANGTWKPPYGYNKVVILEREHQVHLNKIHNYGYEPPEWQRHCQEVNEMVAAWQ